MTCVQGKYLFIKNYNAFTCALIRQNREAGGGDESEGILTVLIPIQLDLEDGHLFPTHLIA